MSFFGLIFKSTFRNRLRTGLTALGVAIAIIAFLVLRTMVAAWYAGVDAASSDRMVVRNKISIIFPLPYAYLEKVKQTPGVEDVSFANWFAGVYIDEKQFFAQFATDAESYYRLYPEFKLPPEQMKAWLDDRTGAVVGDLLASKYNWKIGDKVVLKGTIYQGDFEFTIRGIYTGAGKTDRQQFQFHYKYLNEKIDETQKDRLGIILAKVKSQDIAPQIDKMFANSANETRTESELAFQRSFMSMVSNILVALQIVSVVVLIILILILGNTMAMATRERTSEYAAMRAIGFKPKHVTLLVLGEGFVVAAIGAAFAIVASPAILRAFADMLEKNMGAFLGAFELDPKAALLATVVALGGGMLAATIPAWRASRMRIVDALRRIE
jgi:putative ABC transport system permease protein